MTPYASSTSPSASSAGSAPPATPQTPWTTISSNPSPLISQHNLSPVSPSSQFTNPTVTFDQIVVKSDQSYPSEQSVLDLAARAGHPLGGILVPQKTYRPHTMSDRRRYVEDVHLDVPIMFYTHNPFGCGISLKDALSSKFSSLEGRDDSMFAGRGPSVSIRLNVSRSFAMMSWKPQLTLCGDCSGRAMHPGADRSPRGTSVAHRTLSPAPNLRATWRRPSTASSWRWSPRTRRTLTRPDGASGRGVSGSRTWPSSVLSTCPWARGKRTFA